MESATYLTSLLLDQYENQDCTVEAAIVKVSLFVYCIEELIMKYVDIPTSNRAR